MLKHLLFVPILMLCTVVHAQNFTLAPNPVFVETTADAMGFPGEMIAESTITNNTSDTLNMRWERIVNDKPECWVTSVFGISMQFVPMVNTADFVLFPNTTGIMNVHTYPEFTADGFLTAGEGEVVLKITNLDEPSDTLLATYNFLITGDVSCVTNTSEIDTEPLIIYPNPSSDFFQLSETQAIQQLLMYDMLGQQIRQFEVTPNQHYDIKNLADGVYWVQLMDRRGEAIETIKFLKH